MSQVGSTPRTLDASQMTEPKDPGGRTKPVSQAVTVPWDQVERFMGQVSHDLRNGLNACELQLTYLSEISTDPEAAAEVKQLRQSLAGIARQLQALRTSVTGSTAHTMVYPAADLFEDLRERFARLHAGDVDKLRWQIDVDADQGALVDPELTLAASLELLLNALHFAEKSTPIDCRARVEGDRIILSVAQTVAEPPATALQDWGATPLVSSRRGAYGLGLFRARRILEAQGSRLSFDYVPEIRLLTATVTLPGAASSPLAQP